MIINQVKPNFEQYELKKLLSAQNEGYYKVESQFYEVSIRFFNQSDYNVGVLYMLIHKYENL